MKILFIDNYDSFTYNVIEILRQFNEVELTLVKNDELSGVEAADFDKLIISPGPNLPSVSGGLMTFIEKNIHSIPTLGICLGHQAIAEFFGGSLRQYQNPKHGEKTKLLINRSEGLFKKLPVSFEVGLYHSWYVSMETLPNELIITAQNDAGIVMGLQHDKLPIYGLQFHPESYMSEYGYEILQNFIYPS